ncbi:hypothetical protein O181_037955 [Austropuccinia psidii MF-1]|uniref:SUI1 domain-containing protein n=1 Tax=Austropuccinia psidii MF-1 TaxID=1389203 RepID=A0A9Q3D926_9BASI|nr:hypothetical protein [Austropuccinia psidii MF-1]
MFKRSHSVKPFNSITNSARKKLIKDSLINFSSNSSNPSNLDHQDHLKENDNHRDIDLVSALNQLIPSGLRLCKAFTHLNQKLLIYSDLDQQPIWFQIDKPGNLQLIPTIYTLLKYPKLLPIINTNQHVLSKLTGGADLMIPGITKVERHKLKDLKKDTLISIGVIDQPHQIWAVGLLAQDGNDLLKSDTGKAVLILHTQDDFLWKSGNQRIPNPLLIPSSDSIESKNSNNNMQKDQDPAQSHLLHSQNYANSNKNIQEDVKCTQSFPFNTESAETFAKPLQQTENLIQSSPINPAPELNSKLISPSTPSQVDEILVSALLLSMSQFDYESQLPMIGSLFYSHHIQPFRPADCPRSLGIKDSSAKNLTKWLKLMQKRGYLHLKEDRKLGQTFIVSINSSHPDVEKVVKYRTLADEERKDSSRQQSVSQSDGPKSSQLAPTTITTLFKAVNNSPQWHWLNATNLDPQGLHTREEIKTTILDHLENSLPERERNKKLVQPSQLLSKALMMNPIMPMTRLEMMNELLLKLQAWWKLERAGEVLALCHGEAPSILLRMKKTGAKKSTLLTGLELVGLDPTIFAKELKTLCAGSTTTHSAPPSISSTIPKKLWTGTPGNLMATEIECQGDQRNMIRNYLIENFEISKSIIQII